MFCLVVGFNTQEFYPLHNSKFLNPRQPQYDSHKFVNHVQYNNLYEPILSTGSSDI